MTFVIGICATALGIVAVFSAGGAPSLPSLRQTTTLAAREGDIEVTSVTSGSGWRSAAKLKMINSCMDASAGPVLDGRDVVAYWSLDGDADAVVGDPRHATTFAGYSFHFASRENQALFEANPTKYVPQWGGFCAYGVAWETWWTAANFDAEGDPDRWVIADDKLFIFRGNKPKAWFMANVTDSIQAGDETWAKWYNGTTRFDTACFFYAGEDDA